MGKVTDLTDKEFGILKVVSRAEPPGRILSYKYLCTAWWLCQCQCGNTKVSNGAVLKHAKSCGCLSKEGRARSAKVNHSKRGMTAERRPVVEALLRSGVSATKVAQDLHISHNKVIDVRNELGLIRHSTKDKPRKPEINPFWTDEVICQFRQLWTDGHSTAEIGRRLGTSKGAIVGKANRLCLDERPSPIGSRSAPWNAAPEPAPETRMMVERLLTEGRSNVYVAEQASISVGAVRKIRKGVEVKAQKRPPIARCSAPQSLKIVDTTKVFTPLTTRIEFRKPSLHDDAAVAEFIARRGVTVCPAAAVAGTTASISAADRGIISQHQKKLDDGWSAKLAPRIARAVEASRRARGLETTQ